MAEARALTALVQQLPDPGPIVEIGTLFGWSTKVLALAKEPQRPLLTVDSYSWNPWGLTSEQHYAITRASLKNAMRTDRVEVIRRSSEDFFAVYQGPAPSLCFIDADHSYDAVTADIEGALRIGSQVICGHDYQQGFPGVIQAVDEAGGPATVVDTLWVLPNRA